MNPDRAILDFWLALGGLVSAMLGVLLLWVAWRRRGRGRWRGGWRWPLAAGVVLVGGGVGAGSWPYIADRGFFSQVMAFLTMSLPVLGWTFIACAVVVAGRFVVGDGSRGRKRCRRCWYDMSGVPGRTAETAEPMFVCPECGKEARTERQLRCSRRRWWIAACALALGAMGYGGLFAERAMRFGLYRTLPTPIIVGLVEWAGWPSPSATPMNNAVAHLPSRMQRLGVLKGFVYRRMARHWTLEYRKRWPADVPLVVRTAPGYAWWGLSSVLEMRFVKPDAVETDWVTVASIVLSTTNVRGHDESLVLGKLPAVSHTARGAHVEFRIRDKGKVEWQDSFWLPVTRVERVDDVTTPARSAAVDLEIANGFAAYPEHFQSSQRKLHANVTLNGTAAAQRMSVALRIEFVHRGRVVGEVRTWDMPDLFLARRVLSGYRDRLGGIQVAGEYPTLCTFASNNPDWAVHITADPELALRDFGNTKYWAGDIWLHMGKMVSGPPRWESGAGAEK